MTVIYAPDGIYNPAFRDLSNMNFWQDEDVLACVGRITKFFKQGSIETVYTLLSVDHAVIVVAAMGAQCRVVLYPSPTIEWNKQYRAVRQLVRGVLRRVQAKEPSAFIVESVEALRRQAYEAGCERLIMSNSWMARQGHSIASVSPSAQWWGDDVLTPEELEKRDARVRRQQERAEQQRTKQRAAAARRRKAKAKEAAELVAIEAERKAAAARRKAKPRPKPAPRQVYRPPEPYCRANHPFGDTKGAALAAERTDEKVLALINRVDEHRTPFTPWVGGRGGQLHGTPEQRQRLAQACEKLDRHPIGSTEFALWPKLEEPQYADDYINSLGNDGYYW